MAQHSWQTRGVVLAHHFFDLAPASTPSTSTRPISIFFVNGLMLPQSMWTPTLDLLKSTLALKPLPDAASIHAVTYDRYGQGESRPSSTEQPDWQPVAHDMVDAAGELADVITCIQQQYFPRPGPQPKIIVVSHSIGVPLVRIHDLLQDEYSSKNIYAHLFLDSNMANNDFTSIFPDPDDKHFRPENLPNDTTVEDLRKIRQRTRAMFHPSISNSERLDRKNLKDKLPRADEPKLVGPDGEPPYLTVLGHDPGAFAEEGFRLNGTPRGLNEKMMQPVWDEYNRGLLRLGEERRTKGVVIAEGAGHFIQRDSPQCVADEIIDLIAKVLEEGDEEDVEEEKKMRSERSQLESKR